MYSLRVHFQVHRNILLFIVSCPHLVYYFLSNVAEYVHGQDNMRRASISRVDNEL